MTPQLRQAIKLLQFSNLELSSYIEEEIEKNPFLENKKNDVFIDNQVSLENGKGDLENKDESRWDDKFNYKSKSHNYDELSSFEDRIAEPKKISQITYYGTDIVRHS
jgi:RNA polymerase sigma-54 factor